MVWRVPLMAVLVLAVGACGGGEASVDPSGDGNSDSAGDMSGDMPGDDLIDGDNDGFTSDVDCDDDNPAVNPGATEVCDRVDNDCDDLVDDADDTLDTFTGSTFFADTDADGFGDAESSISACAAPAGFVIDATDCDDGVAAINPSATEVCDTVDNDCDDLVDDADDTLDTSTGSTFYADTDADNFGDAESSVRACAAPMGFVSDATDCDDDDPAINLNATEVCDTVDNDCDDLVDDADDTLDTSTATRFYADTDVDGFGDPDASTLACAQPAGFEDDADDCDDTRVAVNPNATEICDGLDNDCDDDIDRDDASVDLTTTITYYEDADSDGFGNSAVTLEVCGAENTSGFVLDNTDCDDDTTDDVATGGDAANTFPGSAASDPDLTASDCSKDSDGDGFGDNGDFFVGLTLPFVEGTDCDDVTSGATATFPGNFDPSLETFLADDDCTRDADDDGYADPGLTSDGIDGTNGSDCQDADGTVFPGAIELCDGQFNDCNDASYAIGSAPADETDDDEDEYVECLDYNAGDFAADSSIVGGGDCNDSTSDSNAGLVFPGAPETFGTSVDTMDFDCDGSVGWDLDDVVAAIGTGSITESFVVTEFMADTAIFSEGSGEWFEVYNATGEQVDIAGLVVQDNVGSFTVTGATPVAIDQYIVFASAGTSSNGLPRVDYDYEGAFQLNNGGDTITTSYDDTVTLTVFDTVDYSLSGFRVEPGIATSLSGDAVNSSNNDLAVSWCEATEVYYIDTADFDTDDDITETNLGTPGAANPTCPP